MKHKVAGIQMSCVADREENLSKFGRLADMAAESGAAVICCQPFFTGPWFPAAEDPERLSLAEPEDGPTLTALREQAVSRKTCLVAPLFERDGDRRYYTAFVIADDGSILGKYRKVHLPDIPFWREKYYFNTGDTGYPVFDFRGLRFGVQLCWDNFFPEAARHLALGGADIIFAPTAAAFMSYHKWETVMVATAVVNGLYLMRVNRVGGEGALDFYGRSFCADPEGEYVVGPIGLNDGVIMAEVDTDRLAAARRQWNFLKERRPETYGAVTESGT